MVTLRAVDSNLEPAAADANDVLDFLGGCSRVITFWPQSSLNCTDTKYERYDYGYDSGSASKETTSWQSQPAQVGPTNQLT